MDFTLRSLDDDQILMEIPVFKSVFILYDLYFITLFVSQTILENN